MVDASAAQNREAEEAKAPAAPLDDIMLAMDVVDTLRHADQVVERELASDERDARMKERLREIYASQGIEVSDRVLAEGVAALNEGRFVYDPPKSGSGRRWAMLWIRRGVWGRAVFFGLLLIVALAAGYLFFVKFPADRQLAEQSNELQVVVPDRVKGELERIAALAQSDEALTRAKAYAADALAAAKAGDLEGARAKAAELQQLRETLDQAYVIRIVSRPGESSGVYRIPESNPQARNYYLIVEAIDAKGQAVPVTITSEEDNTTRRVSIWGQRVDERTFDAVRADKSDDGIIQNNEVGIKRRGYLEPDYKMAVRNGAILQW